MGGLVDWRRRNSHARTAALYRLGVLCVRHPWRYLIYPAGHEGYCRNNWNGHCNRYRIAYAVNMIGLGLVLLRAQEARARAKTMAAQAR